MRLVGVNAALLWRQRTASVYATLSLALRVPLMWYFSQRMNQLQNPKGFPEFATYHSLRTEMLLRVHLVLRFVVLLDNAAYSLSDACWDN